jgi:hypothetical protein
MIKIISTNALVLKFFLEPQKNENKHKNTTTCLREHVNDIASYY